MAASLNIASPEGWYKITIRDIYSHGGGSLIRYHYSSSLYRALQAVYPEHDWLPWKFNVVSKELWNHAEVRKKFTKHVEAELRLASPADWRHLSLQQIRDLGGHGFLKFYGNSLQRAIEAEVEPAHSITKTPGNQQPSLRDVFDQIRAKIGSKLDENDTSLEYWYNIPATEVRKHGGAAALLASGGFYQALRQAYPEHHWQPWLFSYLPRNEQSDVLRHFLDWAGPQLGVKSREDWYAITYRQLVGLVTPNQDKATYPKSAGRGLLSRYQNSPAKLIMAAFPEHAWDLSKFNRKPL